MSAIETRLPTTPKIQQSQYTVRQLPDGREILKKKNPIFNNNDIDAGQVLGRSQQHANMDYDSPALYRPAYYGVNHLECHEDLDLGQSNGMKGGIEKSMFDQRDARKPSVPLNRSRNDYVSEAGRKTYSPQKNNGSAKPSVERNLETRIAKKPNAAFSNYAYQPDPGNRLGRGNNLMNERQQAYNGAIPKTSVRSENRMTDQQNQQSQHGQTKRYYYFFKFKIIKIRKTLIFSGITIMGSTWVPDQSRSRERTFDRRGQLYLPLVL